MPTADLADFVAANSRVEGPDGLWTLDGVTGYTVPDAVIAADAKLEDTREASQGHGRPFASEIFRAEIDAGRVSERQAVQLFSLWPTELVVDGLAGFRYDTLGDRAFVTSRTKAEDFETALENAEAAAETDFPAWWLDAFGDGPDYAVTVDGQGLYHAESWSGISITGYTTDTLPTEAQVKRALTYTRADTIGVDTTINTPSPSALATTAGDQRVAVSNLTDAQNIETAWESALSWLEANQNSHWAEHFGFTDVTVET